MTESAFECIREDAQKLWVRTPPVTHNVWGFFIKDIFPRFSMPEHYFGTLKVNNSLLKNSAERWNYSMYKYLVREKNEDGTLKSCIVDGENFRWTHADLPDDKRDGLRVHDWGLVYIPHPGQIGYLDSISEDLTQKSVQRAELLTQINQHERETMKGLLLKLKGVLGEQPQAIDELRKKVIGDYGFSPWMTSDYQSTKLLEIGKLPLTSKNPMNTIEGQTELDFYRNLDSFLESCPLDCGRTGYCMDGIYRHLMPEWIICSELNQSKSVL